MPTLSRALRRRHPTRVASTALLLAVLLVVGAYVVAAYVSQPTPGGVVSAVCLLAIAGAGLLYAWRLGAGAPID